MTSDNWRVGKHAVMWKYLMHPNIVPLPCVTTDPVQLVSDHVSGGGLTGCIVDNLGADILNPVGLPSAGLYDVLSHSPVI